MPRRNALDFSPPFTGHSASEVETMTLSFGEGSEWGIEVERDEPDHWIITSYGNYFGEPLRFRSRDDAERAFLLIVADMRANGIPAMGAVFWYRALCQQAGLAESW